MADCCAGTEAELEKLRERQRGVLVAVLLINVVLFCVEMTAGWLASSTALTADALDMLGDSLVYGFSLYVVGRDNLWKARSASLKGWIMLCFGLVVLGQVAYKLAFPVVPTYQIIGLVGFVALAGNGTCLGLLWRHRGDDVNMRSVWVCSRNDIIANLSVLAAGAMVWYFASQWPDVIVGVGIAALFLKSAVAVLRDASATRRDHLQIATVEVRS